jgi:alanine dehydrogenase
MGMGAKVTILDINVKRLAILETLFGSRVELLYSSSAQLENVVPNADLLIGAVLVLGKRAPTLVSRSLVAKMNPGSVIVDVAVDQGGCSGNPAGHFPQSTDLPGVGSSTLWSA